MCKQQLLFGVALLLALILPSVRGETDKPPLGFVCHYPFIDVGMDDLPKSRATVLITRAVMGEIEKNKDKFDFSTLDKQITYAENNHLKLALLLECNPVYCPPWLREECKAAGELQKYADGSDSTDPSINSPIFAKARNEFVRKVIEYVNQRDINRVITHYLPGAEWWFTHPTRYNKLDVKKFQEWLRNKYGAIQNLNNAWKSNYASFENVDPPKIEIADYGRMSGLSPILVDVRPQDCSWSTRQVFAPKVIPGKIYVFSAWVKTKDVIGKGAHLSTSWLPKGSDIPFHMDYSSGIDGTHDWQKITMAIKAPQNAERVWLLLKLSGFGTAIFDDVEFHEQGSKENLIPNADLNKGDKEPENWFFDNWFGGQNIKAEYLKSGGRKNSPCVYISIPHPVPTDRSYQNIDAAVYDWSEFWYEAGAQYIHDLATLVKKLDPSRKIATYLTYAFAFPLEWDYVQANAICPDELCIIGRDIDIIGLQICSADGDPIRITANLDLVRKYGKPPWAIDLLDWTRGVAIGYQATNKVVQTTIQHGGKGIFHYCWHGTLDYNFYPDMKLSELKQMLMNARESLNFVEGMSVVKSNIALLEPIIPASPNDKEGFKNDYRSFAGWYKILKGMHITFDVVTFREIQKGAVDLRKYKCVIVPDCAYIPGKVYLQFLKFIGWGGKVVVAGRFFQFDEFGQSLKFDLEFLKSKVHTIADYGKIYAGEMHRNTWAGNTPPLFIWRTETRETKQAFQSAKSELAKYFKTIGIPRNIEVIPDDPLIHCVEWEGKCWAAYLVNMREEAAQNVEVRFKTSATPKVKALLDAKPIEVNTTREDYWLVVKVPQFQTSCIIKLEP
jgi:hypothetical protein